jgi:hypothetical protein
MKFLQEISALPCSLQHYSQKPRNGGGGWGERVTSLMDKENVTYIQPIKSRILFNL